MDVSKLKGKKSKNRVSYEFYEFFRTDAKYKDNFVGLTHEETKVSLRSNDFAALEQKDVKNIVEAGFLDDLEFIIGKYHIDLKID